MKRILTAAVCLPLFYLLTRYAPPAAYLAFVLLCAGLASWELSLLARRRGLRTLPLLNLLGTLALAWAVAGPPWSLPPALALVSVALPAAYLVGCRDLSRYLESAGAALGGCLFLGVLMGFQAALRTAGGEAQGAGLVFYLFLVVWAGDSGALYVGRTLGRHLLARRLSPKKTVEGALGGLLASLLAALAARALFLPGQGIGAALLLGALLNLLGQLGDLAESGLKRSAGVKDSATFIPGHGGLLDRTDSLLFAGPALFYYYRLFLAP